MRYPVHVIANATVMSDAQLDAEVKRGFDDIAAGRKRPLKQVAADLARVFGL